MIIGKFKPTSDGGWSGTIRTLTIHAKVRLVPNDNRENDRAPVFRIFAGASEIGAAWLKRASSERAEEYLSVNMDCPDFTGLISATLFYAGIDGEAELVWWRAHSQPRIAARGVADAEADIR